jgi:SulP family sulfate permease
MHLSIGGIGVFIAVTSISVTNNVEFTFDLEGAKGFVDNLNLFGVVIFFEAAVRLLDWALSDEKGNSRFPLLAPLFFCSIVPIFYLTLSVLGVSVATAKDMGYFLPDSSTGACVSGQVCAEPALMDRIFDGHVLDIFRIMDIRLVSWTAVVKSLGTLIAMAAFSLIQVPIMIPALAVSTNQDMDMNVELISHGYMNLAAGVFGGIQSVMTYSFSFMVRLYSREIEASERMGLMH